MNSNPGDSPQSSVRTGMRSVAVQPISSPEAASESRADIARRSRSGRPHRPNQRRAVATRSRNDLIRRWPRCLQVRVPMARGRADDLDRQDPEKIGSRRDPRGDGGELQQKPEQPRRAHQRLSSPKIRRFADSNSASLNAPVLWSAASCCSSSTRPAPSRGSPSTS